MRFVFTLVPYLLVSCHSAPVSDGDSKCSASVDDETSLMQSKTQLHQQSQAYNTRKTSFCCCTRPDKFDKDGCLANGKADRDEHIKLGVKPAPIEVYTGYDNAKGLCCKTKFHKCTSFLNWEQLSRFKVNFPETYCNTLYEKQAMANEAAAEKVAADEAKEAEAARAADQAKVAESREEAIARRDLARPELRAAREQDEKDKEDYFSARTAKKAADKEKRAADFVTYGTQKAYAKAYADIATREAASTTSTDEIKALQTTDKALHLMRLLEKLGILTKTHCEELGYSDQADLRNAFVGVTVASLTKVMVAAHFLNKLVETNKPEVDALDEAEVRKSQADLDKAIAHKAAVDAENDALGKVYAEFPDECIHQVPADNDCDTVQRGDREMKLYLELHQPDLLSKLPSGFSKDYCKLFWYQDQFSSDTARQCSHENSAGKCSKPFFGGDECKRKGILID